jgi:hypothetical protein
MNVVGIAASRACATCGIPVDSQYFDSFGFADLKPGEDATLAHFELPPQYCGVLECFSQFTNDFFVNPTQVETRHLEWRLLVNGRPVPPYTDIRAILNPWGVGSYPVKIRLSDGARLELSVRLDMGGANITVGGRISGRYWFPDG